MGLIDKLKAHIEVWKIEKYTKRRDVNTPDFERKDAEYYRDHYQNGVYLAQRPDGSTRTNSSIGRRSTLIRKKSEKIVRCSEVYNTTQ
ncbi:unnamed protein product [Umbelopsis ramanniana]